MHKLLTVTATAILVFGSYAVADDDSQAQTTVKIYRVGDLVSADAIDAGNGFGQTTRKEWGAEYRETNEALRELQMLVCSMCTLKPAAVGTYKTSLSLVVRHTAAGHREIEDLLNSLRAEEAPCIKLECRALFSPDQMRSGTIPNEKQIDEQRILQLVYSQSTVTPQEARELVDMQLGGSKVQTVHLKAGRRTTWGDFGRPSTVVGRVLPGQGVARVRIDNISDDVTETVPYRSQVFEIKTGDSAVFHHYCDGGTVVWLITATVLHPQN